VLLADPVTALTALALRWMGSDPERGCRAAALGSAAQIVSLDLDGKPHKGPAADDVASYFLRWLQATDDAVPGDAELRVWCMHLACRLLEGDELTKDQVLDAAKRLHNWFADGKLRKNRVSR
jgi:hypothetical protein